MIFVRSHFFHFRIRNVGTIGFEYFITRVPLWFGFNDFQLFFDTCIIIYQIWFNPWKGWRKEILPSTLHAQGHCLQKLGFWSWKIPKKAAGMFGMRMKNILKIQKRFISTNVWFIFLQDSLCSLSCFMAPGTYREYVNTVSCLWGTLGGSFRHFRNNGF